VRIVPAFFHNFGLNILPRKTLTLTPGKITPMEGEKSFAYCYPFDASEPDWWLVPTAWMSPRSRVNLTENGVLLPDHQFKTDEVRLAGGDRWTHESGRIVFASSDNSDPRTNGRVYALTYPLLFKKKIGYWAGILFAAATAGLYRLSRGRHQSPGQPLNKSSHWRRHLVGASLLFLAGLYCNTGTLAPTTTRSSDK
jgi:hypothetical protein